MWTPWPWLGRMSYYKLQRTSNIFTLLMFGKPNKTTINKNKTTNFYRSTSFRFSFIFRYFRVFQVSQMFTCGLSDLLLLAVGSFSCFCIARIHFKSSHTRQFWTYLMPDLKYLYRVLYIAFLNKLLIFFLTKLTIKSHIY